MLTEGVHSVVDSTNQLLLMWGRRQAKKPPDKYHPFGYGRELYFWSFVVAVLVFSLGAGVSIYEGIIHISAAGAGGVADRRLWRLAPRLPARRLVDARSVQGVQGGEGRLGWFEAIRRSKDPPAFIVLLENGAAMAGIAAAALGLFLAQLTGDPFYDGAASIVIGAILGITAFVLAYESKGLLIGEAADPDLVRDLRELAGGKSGVVGVGHVLTVHSSPDQVLAMINVDFDDTILRRGGRADRLRCRARGARALAAGAPAVRPPDAGRRQGARSLR